MRDEVSDGMITANICVGCRDVKKGDDPERTHFCEAVRCEVGPVIVTFPRGGKCRDRICHHRLRAARNSVA